MLSYVLEGVRAGLVLSLLVGPILVVLLQLSLRSGTLMAMAGATGIWVGDLLFVLITHYGMGGIEPFLGHMYFNEIVGTVGMLLLVGMAVVMWYRKPMSMKRIGKGPKRRGLLSALAQGFAVNAFNPFTIGFWSFFSITQIHERDLTEPAAWAIYGGILGTIIFTDTLKVLSARKLRELLKPELAQKVQRFGALALAVFGVVLGVRVWW